MSSSEDSLSSTLDNVESGGNAIFSIQQLSDELECHGLRPLPQIKKEEGCVMLETQASSLVSALMDTVWDLLHHYRSAVWRHDDVEDKLHRATGKNKNLQAQVNHLKAELLSKEQLLSSAREKERKLTSECDKLQSDLRNEKKEVHRMTTQATRRDCQNSHELRRKEYEVLQLQEQLRHNLRLPRSMTRQVPNKKEHESNRKAAHEVCRSTTSDVSSNSSMFREEEDLYRKVINKFENNSRSLVQENIKLQDSYCKLHTNLGFLTQQFAVLVEKYFKCNKHWREFEESMNELKILPSNVFHMPYDDTKVYNKELHLLSDRYLATLQTALEKLSSHLELQHSS
ncbi:afadin- and alpha-actinin-binding protein-like isoform X2 [Cryptotermes secundus]|uniref:afadin- and alpha-actinin-binding protein-like isoform X2 n=1 Tax=Cryptotermes secundus TaxID=105785 RepID=UPI000CD7BB8D|nr:afadin- and alpha-actinin-binding protein-like isoform X2 [Cryptotermes secundus]